MHVVGEAGKFYRSLLSQVCGVLSLLVAGEVHQICPEAHALLGRSLSPSA